MTDQKKKSLNSEKKPQEKLADKLVETMTENLSKKIMLDAEELDRLEAEKKERLVKALDEPDKDC